MLSLKVEKGTYDIMYRLGLNCVGCGKEINFYFDTWKFCLYCGKATPNYNDLIENIQFRLGYAKNQEED